MVVEFLCLPLVEIEVKSTFHPLSIEMLCKHIIYEYFLKYYRCRFPKNLIAFFIIYRNFQKTAARFSILKIKVEFISHFLSIIVLLKQIK